MSFFGYENGRYYGEAVPLEEIAAAVGTPTYVYSQNGLLARAVAYREAAPAAFACYALKANSHPALIRLLAGVGLGADVTSGGELFLARQTGVEADRIVYSGVGKTRAELVEALVAPGVQALHVESEMELAVVAEVAAALGVAAQVSVRVNPNIEAETHPYIQTGGQAHKFGVSPAVAVALIQQAAGHPWLEPVGLAVHIGSQIGEVAPFVAAANFLVRLAQSPILQGIPLTYLDVGGGLGIDYGEDGENDTGMIRAWVTAVTEPIETAGYQAVMELGRSLVAPAGVLLTQVLYTKEQGEKRFVIVDAGMNDLLRPTLYGAYHPIRPLVQRVGPLQMVDVVGPVCETGDWLARERPLPPLQSGDYVAILHTGAYGFVMGSNYNGRLRAAEVLIAGDGFRVIRQRQAYGDLLAGCI